MKRITLKKYLIISFIIHLILFLWFLFHDFYTHRDPNVLIVQEKKTVHEQPEVLVMLYPSISPEGNSDIPTQEKPHSESHVSTPSKEASQEKRELPVSPDPSSHEEDQKEPLSRDTQANAPAQDLPIIAPPPAQPQKQNIIPQPQQRPASILSMTSQLLKSSQAQHGNSLAQRDGENRIPSLQELKYLSYQQRIDEMIMNSWRIVSRSFRTPHQDNSSASVSFEINKDGTLAFVQLTSSSGNHNFDRAIIESIKQAAPFPPIPEHLGLERFRPVGGNYHVRW